MQACPTNAIMFGNVNDKESAVSKLRYEDQKASNSMCWSNFIHLANVNYLAKVRNTHKEK